MKRLTALLLCFALFFCACSREQTESETEPASRTELATVFREEIISLTEPETDGTAEGLTAMQVSIPSVDVSKSVLPTKAPEPTTTVFAIPEPTTREESKTADTPVPPDGTSYPFQVTYFKSRTCLKMGDPAIGKVIDSPSALRTYMQSVASDAYYANLHFSDSYDGQTMDTFCKKYDDTWFLTHRLVMAVTEAPSGSYTYSIADVGRTEDGNVTVLWERKAPSNGILTCDVVYWFYMIEIETTDFNSADHVTVEKQQYSRPTEE